MASSVYRITNQITNKSYIGWTSQSIEVRWKQHKKAADKNKDNRPFYNALRKYGHACWIVELLEQVSTGKIAKEKEIEYIDYYKTYDFGYNATRGGDGNNGIQMSAESNSARSIALKGKSKNYDRMAGKKHTIESRKKISEAHTGMKKPWVKWTPEQIKKRAMTRRSLTEDQYNKIHLLRNEGHTIKFIADVVDANPDVVKVWLKKTWN